jgi:hypothetical protein
MALLAFSIIYFSRRFINAFSWNLSLGFFFGIFVYHLISEDIRQAIENLKLYKVQENNSKTIIDKIKLAIIRLLEI